MEPKDWLLARGFNWDIISVVNGCSIPFFFFNLWLLVQRYSWGLATWLSRVYGRHIELVYEGSNSVDSLSGGW